MLDKYIESPCKDHSSFIDSKSTVLFFFKTGTNNPLDFELIEVFVYALAYKDLGRCRL